MNRIEAVNLWERVQKLLRQYASVAIVAVCGLFLWALWALDGDDE